MGGLAAAEVPDGAGWSDDVYVHGPLIHGLTAAAVNECAQHCEDLFATLRFLRESVDFAKQMLSYNAGAVTAFGRRLTDADDEAIRRMFLVPDVSVVERGLQNSADSGTDLEVYADAVARLGERVRTVAEWYWIYEDFHVQYKHGLKLAMRPYGNPTREAIDERRGNVSGALLAFTSEPIAKMLAGPKQQQVMAFPNLISEARPYLNALVEDRAMLRYKQSGPPVDLDDVVGVSGTVAQLLRIAAANRIAVADGPDEHGSYKFELPGERPFEVANVVLEIADPPTLADFSN